MIIKKKLPHNRRGRRKHGVVCFYAFVISPATEYSLLQHTYENTCLIAPLSNYAHNDLKCRLVFFPLGNPPFYKFFSLRASMNTVIIQYSYRSFAYIL